MAQFNADIQLSIQIEKALAGVKKVESAIAKIAKTTIDFGSTDIKQAKRSIDVLGKTVKGSVSAAKNLAKATGFVVNNFSKLAAAVGAVELTALAGKFGLVNNAFTQAAAAANGAVGAVAKLSAGLAAAAATAPGLATAIAASTVGLVAFGPQLATVSKRLLKLAGAAGTAKQGFEAVFNAYNSISGAMDDTFFSGDLPDATRLLEAYRKALFEVNETVSELGRRQDKLQSTLNQFNSGSATAEKIATKLVAVTARYNEELREQADLLRRVKGLSQTTLEEAKGVKSIETRKRREDFQARQAQELEQVYASIARLNERGVSALDKQLGIEREITAAVMRRKPQMQTASAGAVQERLARDKATTAEINKQVSAMRLLDKSGAKIAFNTKLQYELAKLLVPQVTKATEEYNEQVAAQKRLNKFLEDGRRIQAEYARDRDTAKKARSQRAESLALGVGFPLLFGGGAGSVLGSAAGSFVGKDGFGGQILGGALGQAIDQYIQGLASLANSLESTTGIIEGLEEAGYSVSAATESVIASYQEAGLEAEAYQLAIAEINRVLGPDGASKLSDYRIANEELQGAFEEAKAALDAELLPAITGMIRLVVGLKGAFDTLAESPIFKLVTGGIGGAVKSLPGVGGLVTGFETLQQIGAPSGDVVVPESQRLAQEDAKLKKLTEQTEELTKQQEKQWKIDDTTRRTNEALEAQIAVEKAGTDIKDDNVYLKSKEAIEQKYLNDLIVAGTNAEAIRRAELTKTLSLLKLDNRRNKALTGGGSGGGVDKEAQAQKAIAAELTKQFELETKMATIGVTKLEKINTELARLEAKKALKVAELELSTEDSRVLAEKLQTLNLETDLLREQLELQKQRLEVEKVIDAMKAEQRLADLDASLNTELQNAQRLPTGDIFKDEENDLLAKQAERSETTYRKLNNQIAIQNKLLEIGTKAQKANAAAVKPILEQELALYQQMLPQIAAAEQAQLKFNQTLSLVEGPVNAFVNGLTEGLMGLIDGTKTAEEAFADMLKGMGQALIQQAAIMIAQYIAIGIARAFAGMGSAPDAGDAMDGGGSLPWVANPGESITIGMAEGGYVTRPTSAVVGEGGEPEYVIPASKMAGAMSRYSSGERGSSIISPYGEGAEGGSTAVATAPMTVTVEGGVTVMDNQEYIRKDQLPSIIDQASKQGETRALSRIRNSPGTRRRLGL